MKEKRYEAAYAGFVYEAPATHWTPSTVVRQRLTKMDFTKPDGIELGGMPIISDGQTAFVDAADGHTAVLACSGMKKSICGFMPLIVSLAQAGENLIVTDPKGELYDRTAGLLQHRGYQVYCLNFRSMDKDCFNILSYAAEVYRNGDQNKGLSLLSDIVNALAEEQRQRAKDNFWPDTAALWLNGTGAVMLDAFPDIKQVKAKGKSYTEIGQLILRIDATAPGRLCLGDDEYLLARNALNDLRNQRIASGGYTDATDAALANLLRAKVPFHLFGHMR